MCAAIAGSKERPDAVFAVNDPAAIHLILEARKRGITIGRDLGVVGFSNDSRSDVIDPPLTTLGQPIGKMAESCIHLLVNKIGNPAFTIPASTILKTQLIQRTSSVRGEIL
ncbi:substrate-binding domain-containing protein [Niabella hibiscisoli]|uniref:substrate-binding domain-containing protein n=1 Tax=Niabella hibiscisoli TaxID=1825928 RepID=UPI001F0E36F9|nr:substrate-binding domain-containing protein [Niabella hibiscisoli]MCH5718851.1 substrate-binding domain-containing protein [Niabella hibiscisoli]